MQATLQYKRWKGPSVSFQTHLISTHFSCFITETLLLLQFYIPVPPNFLIFTSESLFSISFFFLSVGEARHGGQHLRRRRPSSGFVTPRRFRRRRWLCSVFHPTSYMQIPSSSPAQTLNSLPRRRRRQCENNNHKRNRIQGERRERDHHHFE